MTFRLVVSEIRDAVSDSLAELGFPAVPFDVSEPPRKEFGDITCNVAFLLGKQLKNAPPKIAAQIIDRLRARQKPDSFVKSIEPHPAGYINFRIEFAKLSETTVSKVLAEGFAYGRYDSGDKSQIVIEHTSVNPNKALHVGHMRNVILGDSLYRIMKAANHPVTVLNYVDDSGLQVADIVVGFRFAGFAIQPPDPSTKFDKYCGDEVYVKVNELYTKNPELAEKRKVVLREIEEGRSELAQFAASVTTKVLRDQLQTCWRMKARYDLLNFESQIVHSRLWQQSFELMKENGLVRLETEGKNAGCWVIEAEGEEDKVVVRSDGTATYIAKDIPYAAWKIGLVADPFSYNEFARQWDGSVLMQTTLADGVEDYPRFSGGNKVITLIDSRQARLQRIISQVLSKMGAQGREYLHLGYEAVTLSADTARSLGIEIGDRQFMHMSGRKGVYVNADYVLDMLHAKAYEEVMARNPEFSDRQLHDIAEQIAVSAVRYNLTKQDLDKIITFDIKESLSLEGDTGPYMQYAYARAQRIIEKSGAEVTVNKSLSLLVLEREAELVKEISKLDMVVEEAARSLSPKSIARYAYSLATAFNLFYEHVQVLREPDKELLMARLALVKAFGIALKNALELLGVSALERM